MRFTETKLKGAWVIQIEKSIDERGFFAHTWCKRELGEYGLNTNVVQAYTSYSKKKGTLRGMHFQKKPYQEAKLVRCTHGAVFDVIIDLRPDSPTFKQWFGVELSQENFKMIYVPENFAHGFLSLQDDTVVNYFVTNFYTPDAEGGIRWDDPELGIAWPTEVTTISKKDLNLPDFNVSDFR